MKCEYNKQIFVKISVCVSYIFYTSSNLIRDMGLGMEVSLL
jgi:hypothetical protein